MRRPPFLCWCCGDFLRTMVISASVVLRLRRRPWNGIHRRHRQWFSRHFLIIPLQSWGVGRIPCDAVDPYYCDCCGGCGCYYLVVDHRHHHRPFQCQFLFFFFLCFIGMVGMFVHSVPYVIGLDKDRTRRFRTTYTFIKGSFGRKSRVCNVS